MGTVSDSLTNHLFPRLFIQTDRLSARLPCLLAEFTHRVHAELKMREFFLSDKSDAMNENSREVLSTNITCRYLIRFTAKV